MKLKNNQFGSTHVLAIIMVIVIAAIGVIGWKVLGFNISKNTKPTSNNKVSCNKNTDLEICVSPTQSEINQTDTLEYSVSVKNISKKDIKVSGGGCGDEVSIKLNDKQIYENKACPAVITSATIKVGETNEYNPTISTRLLKTGNNEIEFGWSDIKSSKVSVILRPLDSSDTQKLEECYRAQTQKSNCVLIAISIRNGYYKDGSSCEELEKYVSQLNLHAFKEYCNLSSLGILSVSAPQNEADSIITKLKQLKEIESASIDGGQQILN